jgi:hypothetical protein
MAYPWIVNGVLVPVFVYLAWLMYQVDSPWGLAVQLGALACNLFGFVHGWWQYTRSRPIHRAWVLRGIAVLLLAGTLVWGFLHILLPDLQPDADGIIHHPIYGDYPAYVPYHEGMTLYPGQTMRFRIPIEPLLPPEDCDNPKVGT